MTRPVVGDNEQENPLCVLQVWADGCGSVVITTADETGRTTLTPRQL